MEKLLISFGGFVRTLVKILQVWMPLCILFCHLAFQAEIILIQPYYKNNFHQNISPITKNWIKNQKMYVIVPFEVV